MQQHDRKMLIISPSSTTRIRNKPFMESFSHRESRLYMWCWSGIYCIEYSCSRSSPT